MSNTPHDQALLARNRERNDQLARESFARSAVHAKRVAINPIHWQCYTGEPAKVVDLRTLPEGVTVAIIQAALNVSFRYNNGQLDVAEEDAETVEALNDLAVAAGAISLHMHEVSLVPCP